MPYAILVSVIIGVTNIIPFFGPYLGAIPCIFLILLVDPMKGLYFTIFVLVLQQFDGNILGPKIIGDSTGLSSFMVIVAILVGGGFFGIVGMIVGVPVFAVLYASLSNLLTHSLRKKEFPDQEEVYHEIDCLDPVTHEPIPFEKEPTFMDKKKNMVENHTFLAKLYDFLWRLLKRILAQLLKFMKLLQEKVWEKIKAWLEEHKHKEH
jgi:hypothetical protein